MLLLQLHFLLLLNKAALAVSVVVPNKVSIKENEHHYLLKKYSIVYLLVIDSMASGMLIHCNITGGKKAVTSR
jgi:hypothetical protein